MTNGDYFMPGGCGTCSNAVSVWGDGEFISVSTATGGLRVYSVDSSGNLTHIIRIRNVGELGGVTQAIIGDGDFIYHAGTTLASFSVDDSGHPTFIDDGDRIFTTGVWVGQEN